MSIVHIRVNNRDYDIACDDGQEEQLRFLADEVDDRARSLVFRMGSNPGEGMALLMTALTMVDELVESKKEIERLSAEIRRMTALMSEDRKMMRANINDKDGRMAEIEAAMAGTLEEIALRIEKIAQQVEIS